MRSGTSARRTARPALSSRRAATADRGAPRSQCFDAGDGFEVGDERTTVREGRTARLVVCAKAGRNRRRDLLQRGEAGVVVGDAILDSRSGRCQRALALFEGLAFLLCDGGREVVSHVGLRLSKADGPPGGRLVGRLNAPTGDGDGGSLTHYCVVESAEHCFYSPFSSSRSFSVRPIRS
jgi:hypothetical protein